EGQGTIGQLTATSGTVFAGFGAVTDAIPQISNSLGTLNALEKVELDQGATLEYSAFHATSGGVVANSLKVSRITATNSSGEIVLGPPSQVILKQPSLVSAGSILTKPGESWSIIHMNDVQGTTTGNVRVHGQVIDGVLDSVEFAKFTFTPDSVKA